MPTETAHKAEGEEVSRNYFDKKHLEFLKEVIRNLPDESVCIVPRQVAREVLTEKRMEIIEKLREEDASSKRNLAQKLDRDIKNVSEDLDILWEHGIVEYRDGKGTSKKPVIEEDKIIIEPL
ncbi:MAG: hypothetical protein ABEK04_02045 [Candidatus Nanohalobium sp.]